MAERVIVSFWMPHAGLAPHAGRPFLTRAQALTKRAEALGATLVAFGSQLCAFAFDPDELEEAIGLASSIAEETAPDEVPWTCGVAEGNVEPFAPGDVRGGLAWGPPVASGAALARVAHPGEALIHATLARRSELVMLGSRLGVDGGRKVRGGVLDATQAWRTMAAAQVERLRVPPMVGREDPSALLWVPGALALLRADSGYGGTRVLAELGAMVAPAPTLFVTADGAGLQPLGALRRALARAKAAEASHLEPEVEPALRRLLSGDGLPIDTAATIVASFLRPAHESAAPGALFIDDVFDLDPSSLEACAHAVATGERSFPCVVRLDSRSAPPAALAALPKGPEIELKPLDQDSSEALVASLIGGPVEEQTARRWARRGGGSPLAIVEAVSAGLSTGELAWDGETVVPRRRSAGRGRARPAADWIVMRARTMTSPIEQLVLAIVALHGGDVSATRLAEILAAANVQSDAQDEATKLCERRWLMSPEPGFFCMPTRTHRHAILGELADPTLRAEIHRAIAHVIEREDRGLALADAAYHVAHAGDGARAARIALSAARAAGLLELPQAVAQLVAFARDRDPLNEDAVRGIVGSGIPGQRSAPPAVPRRSTAYVTTTPVEVADYGDVPISQPPVLLSARAPADTEPPTIARPGAISSPPDAVSAAPASDPPTTPEAEKRSSKAPRPDTRALDRWTEELTSVARGRITARMQAIMHLSKGDVGEALRLLRNARTDLEGQAGSRERCQASLALGVALAVAGRPDEALLEALDALARARELGDERGGNACLAFLAKLYTSVGRNDEADSLRAVARAP